MEEHYTSSTDYLLEVTLLDRPSGYEGVVAIKTEDGEMRSFEDEEEAEEFAFELIVEMEKINVGYVRKYTIIEREKYYVCAAADDFWDEVDSENKVLKEVFCGDA